MGPERSDGFADACLKLEEDWDSLIPAMRENRFKLAVNELARAIQMPEFVFHFSMLERQFRGRLKEEARAAGETWAMSNLGSLFD